MKKQSSFTKKQNSGKKLVIGSVLLLITLILIGLVLLNKDGAAADIVQDIPATLECTNNQFQGDVILVTNLDKPLQFRCDLQKSIDKLPQGYIPKPAEYKWKADSGDLKANKNQCAWSRMDPGLQTLDVSGSIAYLPPAPKSIFSSQQPKIIHRFSASTICLAPIEVESLKDGKIDGFEVGVYPDPTDPKDLNRIESPVLRQRIKDNADVYAPPRFFYPVTPETYFIRIFDSYTLGEFDLDPRFITLEYPRFIAIDPKLLEKIKLLEALMREEGVSVSKFNVIYGFRSPAYNIGSWKKDGEETLKEPFSVHMYGKALDFIVDEDHDLVIDDLNQDGKISPEDAKYLLSFVNKLDRRLLEQGSDLVGGAGYYYHHDFWERGRYVQTPYVHMDIRNYVRENGTLIRWVGHDTIGVQQMAQPYKHHGRLPPNPLLNK